MKWVRRKAHPRALKMGGTTNVSECWVPIFPSKDKEKSSYIHFCPECGAAIISVNMPNGGWGHFEADTGLHRVKHPCLHRGEDFSKIRDKKTIDLFEG